MTTAHTAVRSGQQGYTARSGFSLVELLVVIGIIAILTAILLPVFLSARASAHTSQCLSNQRQLGNALLLYTQDNDGRFPRGLAEGGDVPGKTTPPKRWDNLLFPYVKNKQVYRCPACVVPSQVLSTSPSDWPEELAHGYAMNDSLQERTPGNPGVSHSRVSFPATTVAFTEFAYRTSDSGGYLSSITMLFPDDERSTTADKGTRFIGAPGALRHRGGSNYTFLDGHVKWHTPSQVGDFHTPNKGITPTFHL